MANITRFNPFNEITRFDPFMDMSSMLNWMTPRTGLRGLALEDEPQMRIDVSEQDNSYMVKAEIPGVHKEDIHVAIEGNRVSISAEIKKEMEAKEGEKLLRCERCYGKVSRSFTLESEVDQNTAQAKYADGVLEIKLPKKAGTSHKEIAIS